MIEMEGAEKKNIIDQLQKEICSMQGFREPAEVRVRVGLEQIETAFPNHIFPTGAIHEFLSNSRESAAATAGFMAGLAGRLMEEDGLCLWIGTGRKLFPPALAYFGIRPERIIFVDVRQAAEVLWATEEALKCAYLSVVVAELNEINFTQSRRLQLAIEQSHVTGLIHCFNSAKPINTLSTARWKITPVASMPEEGMPGLGYPAWQVELLKVRNGKPGIWQLQWVAGRFRFIKDIVAPREAGLSKAG